MRTRGAADNLLASLILLIALSSSPLRAGGIVRRLSDFEEGLGGWQATGAWHLTDRRRAGTTSSQHAESGETGTGKLTSPAFEITGDMIQFLANGWDGREGGLGLNGYFLRDARTGETLRTARPPLSDAFTRIVWLVSDLRGRKVFFEAVDGDSTLHGAGFAWIGLDRVVQASLDVPAERSRMHALTLPQARVWGIITRDGRGRKVESYLSSLPLGERATGSIRGPDFIVTTDSIHMVLLGHDGPPSQPPKRHNYVALIDAETGKQLARAEPPRTDDPTEVAIDTSKAKGKTAYLVAHDGLADAGYAWFGIKSVRVGERVVRFSGPELPDGWRHTTTDRASFCQIRSIPFLAGPRASIGEKGCIVPVDARAQVLYLCGLTNTEDRGCPCWAPANATDQRLFLGDDIGNLRVVYADGDEDRVPLRLGYTAWWYRPIAGMGANEPFAGSPKAERLLDHSLHLLRSASGTRDRFVAVLRPRQGQAIDRIVVQDNPEKAGEPLIYAMTVETDHESKRFRALPHDRPTSDDQRAIRTATVSIGAPWTPADKKNLEALRSYLYVSEKDFADEIPLQIPADYRGPRANFAGNAYAAVLTNMWHWNIHDMDLKVDSGDGIPGPNWYWPDLPQDRRNQDDPGTFHTSTPGAPTWGGYEGVGAFKRGYGAYAGHAWSRDYGRVMQELLELGFLEDSALSASWAFDWARWWPRNVKLPDGAPAPPHWCRIINHPDWMMGDDNPYGNPENDGQALMGLWIYKHWQNAPHPERWARKNFPDIAAIADHIVWQMDNPQLSGFDRVLLTDSECSAGRNHGHYADVFCWHMMIACADIADAVGRESDARRWRTYADRLLDGINDVYIERTDDGEPIWTLRNVGWPHQMAAMAAIMAHADYFGFNVTNQPPIWRAANRAAYRRAIDRQCFPEYSAAPAMGYGQSFLCQCALLTDHMADATRCIENLAKYAYSPLYAYFITPEGCEIDIERNCWHRTGDIGNAVQQGESVKVMRLVLGIDDLQPEHTKLIPRLPLGWTRMRAMGYPVLTLERSTARGRGAPQFTGFTGGLLESFHLAAPAVQPARAQSLRWQRTHRSLQYRVRRMNGEYRMDWHLDGPLEALSVRVGPYSERPSGKGVHNGHRIRGRVVKSGDSWWIWFDRLAHNWHGKLCAPGKARYSPAAGELTEE